MVLNLSVGGIHRISVGDAIIMMLMYTELSYNLWNLQIDISARHVEGVVNDYSQVIITSSSRGVPVIQLMSCEIQSGAVIKRQNIA